MATSGGQGRADARSTLDKSAVTSNNKKKRRESVEFFW
jgi:hypothetical protein